MVKDLLEPLYRLVEEFKLIQLTSSLLFSKITTMQGYLLKHPSYQSNATKFRTNSTPNAVQCSSFRLHTL